MGVRDNQLHAGETPPDEIAREVGPEGLGLRCADGQAQHPAASVGVDADGEGHGDADDATALTDLQVGGVDPRKGPFALDGASQEGIDPFVDLFAQTSDLAPGDAGPAMAWTRSSIARVETPWTYGKRC